MKPTPKQPGRPSLWKWLIGGIVAILLLFGSAVMYCSYHWKPVLSAKLRSAVFKGSGGLYRISFKDLYVNLATGYIAIENPVLSPDTVLYRQWKATGAAPERLFTISLRRLILKDTHPLTAWLHKEIEIGSIIADHPSVKIRYEKITGTAKPKDGRTLYQRISKSLRSVRVGEIFLTNADVQYTDKSEKLPQVTALKNVAVKISGVLIDSASQYDKTRFYSARDFFAEVKNYSRFTPDGMYKIRLASFKASTLGGYIQLTGLRLIPLYPELQFSQKYKFQHDRYVMDIPGILFKKVDFNAFDTTKKLRASVLSVDRAQVKVFLNRSLTPPPIDKWVNFPHVILKKLKVSALIDTLHISRSKVTYTEFNPLSGKSGTLWFNQFDARVTHVTNDTAALLKDHYSRAKLTALLFGKNRLTVFINFNLTDKEGAFDYHGSTQNIDLTSLNALNRPLSLVEVQSGFVKNASFSVSANRYGAKGTLRLAYNHLKITLLKKDEGSGEIKKKGILSLLANTLLVKNDNPSEGGPLRIGIIKFERPHWSSFFNLLWKGVFEGIKQSVGLGIVKDKKTQPGDDKKKMEKIRKARQKQQKNEEKTVKK